MEFVPQNELETALLAAYEDPDARTNFFQVLSRSNLIVIGEVPTTADIEGRQAGPGKGSLRVRSVDIMGVPQIPVFLSAVRIGAFVQGNVPYMAIKARSVLEKFGDYAVFLNPHSAIGKIFNPDDMAGILAEWASSDSSIQKSH